MNRYKVKKQILVCILLVSNSKNYGLCQCARITHYLSHKHSYQSLSNHFMKYPLHKSPIAVSKKKSFRRLLCVNH